MKIAIGPIVALAVSAVAPFAVAAPYANNFEVDTTANWAVNQGPATTDSAANFFFDYSSVGIPAAPSGAGTRGLKLQANQSAGVFGGVSVSPTGLDNTGTGYTLKFDWWANFNGPFPLGGSGSTQLSTYGVGTSGTIPQWPGATPQDSTWFAATVDGNSNSDWRAYSPTAATSYTGASGVYAAGNTDADRNSSDAYYSGFGSVSAPAAQLALYPQQTGTTGVGSAGMEWHTVEIVKSATTVTWTVDGLLIATINVADDTAATGENIFFGHADTNAGSSTDPEDVNLLFTLIDNVQVIVPEPTSLAAIAGLGGLAFVRRRKAL